jgi:hypothetical protein
MLRKTVGLARVVAAAGLESANLSEMPDDKALEMVFGPSADVVAREIEGELILVPIAAGVGDVEDVLFTLNESGRAIWNLLDGTRSLREIAAELEAEFIGDAGQIEADILGLVTELAARRILVWK